MTAQAKSPTVKTVVAHAATLQAATHRLMQKDPFAAPWYPTDASARKRYQRELNRLREQRGIDADMEPVDETELEAEAARRAIAAMDQRAARDFIEYKEGEDQAAERRRIHRHGQRVAAEERDAEREGLSPGQRIDAALAELSVVCNAPQATAFDAPVVSGTGGGGLPELRKPGDPAGAARHRVIETVRFVEEQAEEARRRMVEVERGA